MTSHPLRGLRTYYAVPKDLAEMVDIVDTVDWPETDACSNKLTSRDAQEQ